MGMFHTCHTCGVSYMCTANYCPGCGKPLGHRKPRPNEPVRLIEMKTLSSQEKWFKCSGCGKGKEIPFGGSMRYCEDCGAPVEGVDYLPKPKSPFEYVDGKWVVAHGANR